MNFLTLFIFGLSLGNGNSFYIKNNSEPFLSINYECWPVSKYEYACEDINSILSLDPYKEQDIAEVCSKIKKGSFTNNQFAGFITTKLHDLGLTTCNVSVLNNLGNKELIKQCPKLYGTYCKSKRVIE